MIRYTSFRAHMSVCRPIWRLTSFESSTNVCQRIRLSELFIWTHCLLYLQCTIWVIKNYPYFFLVKKYVRAYFFDRSRHWHAISALPGASQVTWQRLTVRHPNVPHDTIYDGNSASPLNPCKVFTIKRVSLHVIHDVIF